MKKMTYEEFIDNHHQGKVDIGVDNTSALILVKALPMRYYAAHLFWSWVCFLSIPTFICIAIFFEVIAGILLLFIVTPLIWLSTRKSAAQFILNHAIDNKDFFNILVKGDLLTFRFHDGEVAYDHGDYRTAFEKLQPLAEQGHTGAQHCLGAMYANGAGVIQDDIEAIKWIRKAAEQGHDRAQCNLGVMYANGRGVRKDDVEAVEWYRKAAEQNFNEAQHLLSAMYALGRGVIQDDVEAAKWTHKAAEQGHEEAQHLLSLLYREGKGVTQDDVEAAKWTRKAAEQGHEEAQHNLGVMYSNGQGIEKDDVEAVKWYRKAAEQGYDLAKKNLRIITKINSILETGDGSEEHPYIVSDVSEEYLILQHFNKRPTLQAVLETEDGKLMDMITCEDETYYFKLK